MVLDSLVNIKGCIGWRPGPRASFKTGLVHSGGNTDGRSVSSSAYLSNCQGTGDSPTAPRRCLTNALREISRPSSDARCDVFCWQSINIRLPKSLVINWLPTQF